MKLLLAVIGVAVLSTSAVATSSCQLAIDYWSGCKKDLAEKKPCFARLEVNGEIRYLWTVYSENPLIWVSKSPDAQDFVVAYSLKQWESKLLSASCEDLLKF